MSMSSLTRNVGCYEGDMELEIYLGPLHLSRVREEDGVRKRYIYNGVGFLNK